MSLPKNTAFSVYHRTILLWLGFASGLPLALTSGTLQAWMTVENMNIKTIGFFSLVGQAYVFKFIWSPVMDRYTPSFLGRRRGWLIITQLALSVAIFIMGFMHPAQNLFLLALLAVVIAFSSASQDIVFDAYKTDLLPSEQRGNGAAISVLGYRLAMLVSGGLALWLADKYLGWQQTYWLMAILMLTGVIATLIAPEPPLTHPAPRTLESAVVAPLKDFFGRNNAWLILLLIVLYKLGDAFAGSLSTTFLIRGVGFQAGEVGLVNKSLGLLATIVGALYGGSLMKKLTLYRALMIFGLLQGTSNAAYWVLAITDKHLYSMGMAIFIENLCAGMGTAAFVALLMTLCNSAFSATQFALLSALSAVGRVYVGPIAGWFVEAHGWAWFYLFSIICAFPGLILLALCRRSLEYTQAHNDFLPRQIYPGFYRWALRLLLIGTLLIIITAILLLCNSLNLIPAFASGKLFALGAIFCLCGIVQGTLLDIIALRKLKIS
jgi:PAT family beta-lactamase induction signal transducer AmpG